MWVLNSPHLNEVRACAIFLPFSCFFLVASYGYTLMMAVRFKGSHRIEGFTVFKRVPLYTPLLVSLVLALPQVYISSRTFIPLSCLFNISLSPSLIGCYESATSSLCFYSSRLRRVPSFVSTALKNAFIKSTTLSFFLSLSLYLLYIMNVYLYYYFPFLLCI